MLVLTLITVLATKIDFGANINLAIAMVIAVTKATLVILFFAFYYRGNIETGLFTEHGTRSFLTGETVADRDPKRLPLNFDPELTAGA